MSFSNVTVPSTERGITSNLNPETAHSICKPKSESREGGSGFDKQDDVGPHKRDDVKDESDLVYVNSETAESSKEKKKVVKGNNAPVNPVGKIGNNEKHISDKDDNNTRPRQRLGETMTNREQHKDIKRKNKERVKEFLKRAMTREAKRARSTEQSDEIDTKTIDEEPLHRSKRWEYYDTNYNWENDGADYNTQDQASRKETKFEKWAKNWQKHALRFVFIFSFIMMFVCCCCAGCKKFFSRLCFVMCLHCKDWRDVCLNRDPTYRMMRKQADEFGIKLDYEEYKRIKNSYEQSLKKHGYSNVDISGR